MRRAIVDTGPLVAMLAAGDSYHRWALHAVASIRAPLLTCEAVLAEACFLLAQWPDAVDAILERVETGALVVEPMAGRAAQIRRLMRKYATVPMSLADACLVHLSELHEDCVLLTVDSDFDIYRRNGRRTIPLLAPTDRWKKGSRR